MAEQNIGKVVAIIGPVLDIQFPEGKLPPIHNAVRIQDDGKETGEPIDVIAEVAQQLGESVARCVAMKPTDGMVRGMKAVDLGQPTSVEMFETGIKVIDLLEPYTKGGKTGLFGGAGVGKTVMIQELINNVAM